MNQPLQHPVFWLFCNVIDNYGDIGVAWRLARALNTELGANVHLWLDDAAAFHTLCPDAPPLPCVHADIALHLWQPHHADDADQLPPPDVVVETFACDLPEHVLARIRQHRPLWLNWEYLSAETAHERLHLMPSLQADGTQKYFWFMGFSPASGGLLRERSYAPATSAQIRTLRQHLNLPEKSAPEWLLFGYHSPIWAEWLDMWQQHGQAMTLLLAGGKITESLKQCGLLPPQALQNAGDTHRLGCLTLVQLPFVPQHDFDTLLHLSDGLIVRGEDSFVRAQLAAKPFFWHIYPQDENVHLDKLAAFWEKVQPLYPDAVFQAHQALSEELNGGRTLTPAARLQTWQTLMQHHSNWANGVADWQKFIAAQPSALEKLANFMANTLK